VSLFFSVSEGIKGLRRIKGAALLAVLILSLSIAMVGTSAVVGWNGKKFIKFLRSQFDLTTFVGLNTPDEIIIQLGREMGKIEGVRDVIYISPSQAARKFKKEFGEDVVDIVGTNPFPSSFIVRLSPEFGTAVDASYIASRIASMKGIEEVRYRKSLLVSVDRYINILIGLSAVIGFIVVLAAILISSYTIKLTILAKRDLIWTMRLVGATDRFIRSPIEELKCRRLSLCRTYSVKHCLHFLFQVTSYRKTAAHPAKDHPEYQHPGIYLVIDFNLFNGNISF